MSIFELVNVEPAIIVIIFALGLIFLLGAWFEKISLGGIELTGKRNRTARERLLLSFAGGIIVCFVLLGYIPILTDNRVKEFERKLFENSYLDDDALTSYSPRCDLFAKQYGGGEYTLSWSVLSDPRLMPVAFVNNKDVDLEGSKSFTFHSNNNYERFVLVAENVIGNCAVQVVVYRNADAEREFKSHLEERQN